MNIVNVLQQLASHPPATFLDISPMNNHQFGACDISGESPVWEMHPDTDEWFYIIEGRFEITLLEGEGSNRYIAEAGSTFTVPRGIWHKPAAPDGAKFIYFTPGQTLHSEAIDPRVEPG